MKLLILASLSLLTMLLLTACEQEEEKEEEIIRRRPIIQDDRDRELFYYDRIKLNGQADIFFRTFLENVKERDLSPNRVFKIYELENLIPMSKTEIEDQDEYDYYILLMLSGQLHRDYFIYRTDEDMRATFTSISNNPKRDNGVWRTAFKDISFRINPKYIIRNPRNR